jgi:predicted dehydrogenase
MNRQNQKIRVGVIGAGYLGKFHAEKYARMAGVDLVAVVDVDKSRAKKTADRFKTQAYTRHTDIYDKVDAVSVVTPTPLHYPISRDFIVKGVDVLIEKPMTTTLDEADELIALARSQGLIIQVGHLERFNPAVIALEDVIDGPMFVESHRLSLFKDRSIEVSVVLDLMIHDIDILLNFIGSKIKRIHASGVAVITDQVDIANARLEFESGCVANVTTSRVSMKNQRKIRLFQKNAYIAVDFAKREIITVRKGDVNGQGPIPGMRVSGHQFEEEDPLNAELKSFIRSVRFRESSKIPGEAGRNALAVALSIIDQIDANTRRLIE